MGPKMGQVRGKVCNYCGHASASQGGLNNSLLYPREYFRGLRWFIASQAGAMKMSPLVHVVIGDGEVPSRAIVPHDKIP
jgi:hypothetical protein